MNDRAERILAAKPDVLAAARSRTRLCWSWIVQFAVVAGTCCLGVAGAHADFLKLGLIVWLAAAVWSAMEATLLQTALRAPIETRIGTFLSMLVPISAFILACVLLYETQPVHTLAQRAARYQCLNCGYDLRGLSSGVCPECGRAIPA
jgi:hypothetical protein